MKGNRRRSRPAAVGVRRDRVVVLSSVHDALDPRIFHKQARTLAAAGFDVHLVAKHHAQERRDGVWIHGLPTPRSRLGRPSQWLRLAWQAWRLRPRLVHVHDPELLPLLLVLRPLLGAAAVYDAHEYYAEEVARRAWIPAPLRRPMARLTHAVETFAARRIDAVVAVNEHMAAGFRRRGARAVAIYNFPPREYFGLDGPPSPAPAPGPSPSIVYLGLLSPDRGLATVYEASRRLRAANPAACVYVIGRVEWAGLPASVPRDARAWTKAGVEFAGSVPAEAVPAALAEMSVGWIPFHDTANNRRSVPLKLLEYMAAGLPVVASDIGYLSTIVRESGCGLLASAGDAAAHAEALIALMRDPERARQMGDAGRAAVRERFTWAAEGTKLVALYDRLLGVQASAPRGSASQSA
jgi:glycosyltransferase involved in cell wall biosynthesis